MNEIEKERDPRRAILSGALLKQSQYSCILLITWWYYKSWYCYDNIRDDTLKYSYLSEDGRTGKWDQFQNSRKMVFIIVCTYGLRNTHHGMRFDFQDLILQRKKVELIFFIYAVFFIDNVLMRLRVTSKVTLPLFLRSRQEKIAWL